METLIVTFNHDYSFNVFGYAITFSTIPVRLFFCNMCRFALQRRAAAIPVPECPSSSLCTNQIECVQHLTAKMNSNTTSESSGKWYERVRLFSQGSHHVHFGVIMTDSMLNCILIIIYEIQWASPIKNTLKTLNLAEIEIQKDGFNGLPYGQRAKKKKIGTSS